MSEEIEIKLALTPAELKAVEDLSWVKALSTGPVKRKPMRSVYYDTADHQLHRAGLALRVRESAGRYVQTVKAASATIFARPEWECDLPDSSPQPRLLAPLKVIGRKALRPVFATVVTRRVLMLESQGSVIELALDRGHIESGSRKAPICEVELELKSGDPSVLLALAAKLIAALPVRFEPRDKAERGFAVALQERVGLPRRAVFAEGMDVKRGFRAIAKEVLRHLAANHDSVLAGEAAGVRQMRLALMRLAKAFALYARRHDDGEAIRAGFEWLSGEAVPSRAAAALASDRYRKLVLTTALWLAA